MPDIFISYSRKDSPHALDLAERLRGLDLDVWIDTQGIDVSDLWPKEIVQAVWNCKAFILLISDASLRSTSVLRELSLATEKQKPILPVKISPVKLNEEFAYQLAGLQQVSISDFMAIQRALAKLGVVQKQDLAKRSSSASSFSAIRGSDTRISLIVLPFDDLSPSGENNTWFADGLAGELIDALGHIRSLRILDRKTSLGLRGAKIRTTEIAGEFNARYIIDGSVRTFTEQMKISVALLDMETGTPLWQESYRGEYKDIFEIQESVAQKVVDQLKLQLTMQERARIQNRGTEQPEAYKLLVKAKEYFERHTREGFHHALQLVTEAIALDEEYAEAYAFSAEVLTSLYMTYAKDPDSLEHAIALVHDALRIKPDLWDAYRPLSIIYRLQGNLEQAEESAQKYVTHAGDRAESYAALGFFYDSTGQYSKALLAYQQAVQLDPEYLPNVWNLILACNYAGELEQRAKMAAGAIPLYVRHLKFLPDDEFTRACYASVLHFAGRNDDAQEVLRHMSNVRDGTSLYSLACLECELGDFMAGLKSFRKSIEAGYRNPRPLNRFLHSEKEGIASLAGTPEYEEVREMVTALEVSNE